MYMGHICRILGDIGGDTEAVEQVLLTLKADWATGVGHVNHVLYEIKKD